MKEISFLLSIWAALNVIGLGVVLLPVGAAPGQGEAITRECEGISRRIEAIRAGNDYMRSRIVEGRCRVSWYGPCFHGKRTASGRMFNQNERQIAHKSMAFGTVVFFIMAGSSNSSYRTPHYEEIARRSPELPATRITYGPVTDRGPYVPADPRREFDISKGCAEELGIIEKGIETVEWLAITPEGRSK